MLCMCLVLPLFIYPGVTEIDIPDCSNIDEGSFLRTLKECLDHGLSLTTLRLGLCGRCIADDAILDLGYSHSAQNKPPLVCVTRHFALAKICVCLLMLFNLSMMAS